MFYRGQNYTHYSIIPLHIWLHLTVEIVLACNYRFDVTIRKLFVVQVLEIEF